MGKCIRINISSGGCTQDKKNNNYRVRTCWFYRVLYYYVRDRRYCEWCLIYFGAVLRRVDVPN